MSLAVIQASVLQTNGALSVGAGAQITVRTPDNVLATLYTDRAGTTPAGNPVTADGNGFFRVYTTPSRYNITVATGSGSQVYNDVVIEADAEAKRNIAATDPVVTNDETEGYSEWSLWANSATSEVFRCIDATEGAAAWVKTTLTIDELGTAALEDVGTAIGNVVQLVDVGGSPGLPAVDGSQLTGIASSNGITDDTITPASDADVTLSPAQNAIDRPILVTGAWTAARNVIVDNTKRRLWFQNDSSYTATVKTSAGTGIAVAAGTSRPLVCDGTNVIDPYTVDATETEKGRIELATSAEAQAGTDTSRALTPSTLKSAQIQLGTAVAASGTAIDFTNIPSWAKRVTVLVVALSSNSTSHFLVQGGSGSVETTGYESSSEYAATAPTSSNGFIFNNSGAASNHFGTITLQLITGNRWISHSVVRPVGAGTGGAGAGSKTFGGVLDRIRITTVNGTDTFDVGTINVSWE